MKAHYLAMRERSTHDVQLVEVFQCKFGIPMFKYPAMPHREYLEFRLARLRSELDEMDEAIAHNDYIGVADALIDLRYIALGTELTMGMPSLEMFEVVHQANMTKEPVKSASASRFGSAYDIVKPVGWVPPEEDLKRILLDNGWRG